MIRKMRWLTLALVPAGTLMLATGCVVGTTRSTNPGYVATNEPPPPRYENVSGRPGHVWIQGRWEWRGNDWAWVDGHWERERSGYSYQQGYWDRRGDRYEYVEGRWTDGGGGAPVEVRDHRHQQQPPQDNYGGGAPVEVRDHRGGGGYQEPAQPAYSQYPSQPPPEPQYERVEPRSGYVWVAGRWDWNGTQYAWTAGHWERERADQRWEPGHWELRGDHYVWIDGRWIETGRRIRAY